MHPDDGGSRRLTNPGYDDEVVGYAFNPDHALNRGDHKAQDPLPAQQELSYQRHHTFEAWCERGRLHEKKSIF